jgi:hypothetical protein
MRQKSHKICPKLDRGAEEARRELLEWVVDAICALVPRRVLFIHLVIKLVSVVAAVSGMRLSTLLLGFG